MFVFWQIIHKGTQIQMCTHKDTHTQMCELSSTTLCRLSLYIWTFLIQNPFTSGSLSELSKYNNFLRFYPPSNESGKELLLALVNTNFVPIQQLNLNNIQHTLYYVISPLTFELTWAKCVVQALCWCCTSV